MGLVGAGWGELQFALTCPYLPLLAQDARRDALQCVYPGVSTVVFARRFYFGVITGIFERCLFYLPLLSFLLMRSPLFCMLRMFVLFGVLILTFSQCQSDPAPQEKTDYRRLGQGSKISVKPKESPLQAGDLIFQTSQSSQSEAIQLVTQSPYSHVGIIYKDGEGFKVYEAIRTVQLTPLDQWIKRGENGHYVVKRLKNAEERLGTSQQKQLLKAGKKYRNKPYDSYFAWSDDHIYCSELVWKMYKEALDIELGALVALGSYDLGNKKVQQQLKERFKGNLPLDRRLISPAAIFASEELETVVEVID